VNAGHLGDERLDELARINLGLMKEIWLLRDRLMVLERLLERKGIVARLEMDRDEPDPQAEAEIRMEVDRLIARVFEGTFRTGPRGLAELQNQVRGELAAEQEVTELGPRSAAADTPAQPPPRRARSRRP